MTKKREWKNLTQKEKIILVCSFLFFVVMACLVIFSFIGSSKNYVIEKTECAEPWHCSFFVRINTKLSQKELTLIANELRKTSPSTEVVFVFYYLPCMKVEYGKDSWAEVTIHPTLEVMIEDEVLKRNPACLSN